MKALEKGKNYEPPKTTETPRDPEPVQEAVVVETVEEPVEPAKPVKPVKTKTLFDHQGFEQIRDLYKTDPQKMKTLTKRDSIDAISQLDIRFFNAIVKGMEGKK